MEIFICLLCFIMGATLLGLLGYGGWFVIAHGNLTQRLITAGVMLMVVLVVYLYWLATRPDQD